MRQDTRIIRTKDSPFQFNSMDERQSICDFLKYAAYKVYIKPNPDIQADKLVSNAPQIPPTCFELKNASADKPQSNIKQCYGNEKQQGI